MRLLFFVVLGCFLGYIPAGAQEADSVARDSAQLAADSSLLLPDPGLLQFDTSLLLIDTTARGVDWQSSDTMAVYLMRELENFGLLLKEVDRALSRGVDSVSIRQKVRETADDLTLIDQALATYAERMDLRTLSTIKVVVEEIQSRVKNWQQQLDTYSKRLLAYNANISRFKTEVDWRNFPADSILQRVYLSQAAEVSGRIDQMDTRIRKELVITVLLRREINAAVLQASALLDKIEEAEEGFTKNFFQPQHPPLWNTAQTDYARSITRVAVSSFRAIFEVMEYFLSSRWGVRLLNIAIIIVFFLLARYNLKKIRRQPDPSIELAPVKYLADNPLLGSFVVGITLAPFLYLNPPLFYMEFLWLVLALLLGTFIRRAWPRSMHAYWLAIVSVYLIHLLTNFLMDATVFERWLVFVLNLAAVSIGVLLLKRLPLLQFPHPRLINGITRLMIGLNIIALLLNLFGFFSLAKVLGYAGVFGFIFGQALWIFIQLVEEAFFLQRQAGVESRLGSWLHFQDIQEWLDEGLFIVAALLWIIAETKILNIYDSVYDSVVSFLNQERMLGDAAFTFGSILTFILIILATTIISKLIIFFFDYQKKPEGGTEKKNVFGNFAVLIRVGLLSIGFLIALSAAGIPLDRIAIVIGALGVGIGFGLQTIVNNLVSGIILAFERPIQIGDLIELGTMIGTVKEIGIRASKITTFDGAEVIIPNGDLLSQQVTNWTLHDRNRRIELIVGVGYGSDIKQVREVIEGVLSGHSQIMSYPAPMVLVHNFSDSSVDFRLLFWTYEIGRWISVKSEVLSAIYEALYAAKIEIPFPKRDVFVHFPDKKTGRDLPPSPKEGEKETGGLGERETDDTEKK